MTRTCDQCGKHLVTHRAGARFCDQDCKNAWHNEQARKDDAPDKRLTGVSGGVGSRGGNVRSVQEARDLQTASKGLDRWRLVMEVQIHRTLLDTGGFHVDDLDPLGLPPEAFEVRGTLVNAVRSSGVMESTGVYRKVAHAAANARKAPIYRITPKGRNELPKLLAGVGGTEIEGSASPHSGESNKIAGASAGVPQSKGSGGVADLPALRASTSSGDEALPVEHPPATASASGADTPSVPDASPEPLSLLPEPPKMFDPDQRAA